MTRAEKKAKFKTIKRWLTEKERKKQEVKNDFS